MLIRWSILKAIADHFLGILLEACPIPDLPRTELNYPQSYPQFSWKITLALRDQREERRPWCRYGTEHPIVELIGTPRFGDPDPLPGTNWLEVPRQVDIQSLRCGGAGGFSGGS
jgi:hypothetical protein